MTFYQGKHRIESTRLRDWDYTSTGWYFVTLCTRDRECLLGEVTEGKMILSAIGDIAKRYWEEIPCHFTNVKLDTFVIMPNHVHGIIVINGGNRMNSVDMVETRDLASLQTFQSATNILIPNQFGPLKPGSLQAVIHAYKSAVTRWCRKNEQCYSIWQPRFYDHVIRDEQSLNRIRQYILDNPVKWDTDREHVANLWF